MLDPVIRPGVISTVTGMRKNLSAAVGVTCPQGHFDITHLIAVSTQGSSMLATLKRWCTKRLENRRGARTQIIRLIQPQNFSILDDLTTRAVSSILKNDKPNIMRSYERKRSFISRTLQKAGDAEDVISRAGQLKREAMCVASNRRYKVTTRNSSLRLSQKRYLNRAVSSIRAAESQRWRKQASSHDRQDSHNNIHCVLPPVFGLVCRNHEPKLCKR